MTVSPVPREWFKRVTHRRGSFSFSRNFFFFSLLPSDWQSLKKRKKFPRVYVRARIDEINNSLELFFSFIEIRKYFFLSKERFRKKCPFLRKFSEFIAITSERMGITSEEIAIISEVILINGEGILPEKWSKSAIFEG